MFKIMLVDDEPAALAIGKRAIEKCEMNFEVMGEVFDVDAAISLYDRLYPDVVFTDIRMPGKSGLQLIRYINEKAERSAICIALSGYSDFDYVRDAFSFGAFDYLLKPVRADKMKELLKRIQTALKKNQENRKEIKDRKSLSDKEMFEEIAWHVAANLSGDNSIPSVCSHFGISQPYLSRLFKAHEGCTYNEYLTNLRVHEAQKILESDEKILIAEVAERVGINGQFYFSKVFKDATGLSPREYRNQKFNKK